MLIAPPSPTSDALREFLELSPCPFAQLADVSACGPWSDPRALPDRLDDLHRRLDELCRDDARDLLVLELARADRLRTPRDAAALLRATLEGLRARDGLCRDPLTKGIDSPDWDFEHAGERFFVSLFAPFYPDTHSRFSGHASVGFILFQPERGFRRFGVSSQLPGRERLSRAVGRRFYRHGQTYDATRNARTPKALRFVKPLGSDEEPIAWWKVPYEAEVG